MKTIVIRVKGLQRNGVVIARQSCDCEVSADSKFSFVVESIFDDQEKVCYFSSDAVALESFYRICGRCVAMGCELYPVFL